jgi:hypothetical protein
MIRWMFAGLATLALAAPASAAPADPERAAVIASVQQFFDGMAANDPKMIAAVTLADGVNTSVQPQADGSTKVRRIPQAGFQQQIAGTDKYLERMWDPVVTRRGPMAVVWAPYEFQLNGKPHHCGIDVFNLVKAEGRWMISSVTWTTEPDACPELRSRKPR